MRSTVIIVALGCLFNLPLQSQQDRTTKATSREARKMVVPGFRLGLNNANIYGVSGASFSSGRKRGYAAGAFIALPINRFFGIQPEVMLLQKGFSGSGNLNGEQFGLVKTTTHVDIPVQFQLKLLRWFSFLVGPQYSFQLNESTTYSGAYNNAPPHNIFENDKSGAGVLGAILGMDFNLGHFVLSWRSGWDTQSSQAAGSPSYRNRWIQGTVGYRFY